MKQSYICCGLCQISFLFRLILHCMCRPHFVSADGNVGYIHPLAFTNDTAMIWVYNNPRPCFNSFLNILKNRIPGSYSNFMFNFLRNHHTVFQSNHTILHCHQQCTRLPICPHIHQLVIFWFPDHSFTMVTSVLIKTSYNVRLANLFFIWS